MRASSQYYDGPRRSNLFVPGSRAVRQILAISGLSHFSSIFGKDDFNVLGANVIAILFSRNTLSFVVWIERDVVMTLLGLQTLEHLNVPSPVSQVQEPKLNHASKDQHDIARRPADASFEPH